jgi:hypothetical protein
MSLIKVSPGLLEFNETGKIGSGLSKEHSNTLDFNTPSPSHNNSEPELWYVLKCQ